MQLVVPIDDHQRQAIRRVLTAYAAAERSASP
jgi:hypothetical protein